MFFCGYEVTSAALREVDRWRPFKNNAEEVAEGWRIT